ncbi:MAG TPA: FAD-dependent oxidoreductase [Bryobacteraceae bacterium]|nr:FAD-dependent oxidoreductase [Bryobacteraceae bacterium]
MSLLDTNASRSEHLVVAGNGMAAIACVEEILKSGGAFDITIFGEEPHGNYDRTLLASVLAGELDTESMMLNGIEWYQEHGIRTRLGIRVEEIDRTGCAVRSNDGDWTHYDKLILATGASPEIPPMEGLDGAGVFVFGTLDEVRRLAEAARPGARAEVIGGTSAVEVSRALRKRGCEVTNGNAVNADLVVIATNPRPNVDLAREAGLRVNRGIVVNERMETSDPAIFAIGACTEPNGLMLADQAKVLAANLVDWNRGLSFPNRSTQAIS